MELIEVDNTKIVPTDSEGYQLNKTDTVEECVKKYKQKFGVDPVTGYLWDSGSARYLYLVLPEGFERRKAFRVA